MTRSTVLLMLLAALGAPHPMPAQDAAAARAAVACTYETCALRIESSFFSPPKLLRGRGGEEVGRLGWFGGGVDTLLAGPDSAAPRSAIWGQLPALERAGPDRRSAYVFALARSDNFSEFDDVSAAAVITGGGFAIASIPFTLRASRDLSQAVWFYNAALPMRLPEAAAVSCWAAWRSPWRSCAPNAAGKS